MNGDILYKVMVSMKGDRQPEEFLGSVREDRGYTVDVMENHVKEHFSSKQFGSYKFHLYRRTTEKCIDRWKEYKEIKIERR